MRQISITYGQKTTMAGRILILSALVVLLGPLAISAFGQDFTSSTVLINRECSGVTIEPGDLVLSAGHCGQEGRVSILDRSGDITGGTVIFSPPGEGAVVIKLDRELSRFSQIAVNAPEEGDAVTSSGYPRGAFTVLRGSLLRAPGSTFFNGIQFDSTEVSIQGAPGLSGGPLFNSRGEVIGLCSAGNQGEARTLYISLGEIKRSLRTLQPEGGDKRPKLRVWVQDFPPCIPCIRFKTDYKADKTFRGVLQGAFSSVEILDVSDHQELAKKDGVDSIPSFIIGNGKRVRGYTSKVGLLRDLGIAGPEPTPIIEEVTLGEPSIDWSLVRIAIIIKKLDLGGIKGVLASLAEERIGPIERKISEITGGKARVDFIFERTRPAQFHKVTEAAGIAPSPVYVLAMVKRQDLGFIKGIALKRKLLPIAEEALEGITVPIEVIAERTHPTDYERTLQALDHVEPELSPEWEGGEVSQVEAPVKVEDESPSRLDQVISLVSGMKKDLDEKKEEDPSTKFSIPLLAGLAGRRLVVSLIQGKLGIGEA